MLPQLSPYSGGWGALNPVSAILPSCIFFVFFDYKQQKPPLANLS